MACSVADAKTAERLGAKRIELCVSIEAGGLTPSLGLLQETLAQCALPVMAMVRPRAGGFVYDADELATMLRDTRELVAAGAHGVVFGPLRADRTIDTEFLKRLKDAAGRAETVFHRAFDQTQDADEALEILAQVGITRVLTSGHSKSALEGAANLRRLSGRGVEILPGGGIRSGNIRQVAEATGAPFLHAGPFRRVGEGDGPYGDGFLALDEEEIVKACNALLN